MTGVRKLLSPIIPEIPRTINNPSLPMTVTNIQLPLLSPPYPQQAVDVENASARTGP